MESSDVPPMPPAITLAYFFVALPKPVGLPHGYHARFFEPNPDWLSGDPDAFAEGPDRMSGSVAFHQMDREQEQTDVVVAIKTMARAFLWPQAETFPGRPPALPIRTCVAETFVRIETTDEAGLQSAFEKAMHHVELVLQAYFGATQHAVPELTLSSLPLVIPMAIRQVEAGEQQPTWPGPDRWTLHLNRASRLQAPSPPLASNESLEAMQLLNNNPGGPFTPLLSIRRELLLARDAGSDVPTAILCGAAAEVLFRELMMMLLWEEGRPPGEAVNHVSETSVTKIVRNQFHNRIGGTWNVSGPTVIGDWASRIRDLRNRVIHAGYRPTAEEIRSALVTLDSIEKFVGDRLAASLHRFPLTAGAFLGGRGLERRGVLDRFNKLIESLIVPRDERAVFARWRREVLRHIEQGPWQGEAETAVLTLIFYGNLGERWWLVDIESGLACLAEPPKDLTEHEKETNARIRGDIAAAGVSMGASVRFARTGQPLDSPPNWLPLGDVMPLHEYTRHPSSHIPPTI